MSIDHPIDELVPPAPPLHRWRLLAGAVVVALLLPLGAASGLVRPYVTVHAASGQWDRATGEGSIVVQVVNHGIVAATVSSADSPWTVMTVTDPVRIPAHGTVEVPITYRIQCADAIDDATLDLHDASLATTIHVRGWAFGAVDYDIDLLIQAMLPTTSQCDA